MAVVGEAHIIVRAITNQVERDIKRGFEGLSDAGDRAGDNLGKSFRKSLDKQMSASGPGKLADALRGLVPDAEGVYLQFRRLTRISYGLQAGLGAIVGSIGAIVGGLGALIGVAGGAAAALVAVGGAAASIGATFGLAKFALGGIGEALRAGGGGGGGRGNEAAIEAARRRLADATDAVTSAQEKLNRALAEGREELQQIGFAAEEAALQEQAAAIELEKARDSLARVQDLAPSSLGRREAELAFAEAELGYRRSKDAAEDLGKEQERLAKTGVDGLYSVAQARADLAEAEKDRLEAEKALADAINNTNRALSGAASAYSKLTKSQREFADYLKEIKPLFKGLREEVASGFLPVLQTQIQRFINAGLVQVLSRGFSEVGVALGEASELFTDAFLESRGLDNLSSFFSSTAEVAPIFGKVLGQTFGNFLTILQAAEPITRRFIEFLEAKSDTFTNFLNTGSASGELTEFFDRAGELGARFGDVFGNIFGFLGDTIMANFGPGSGGDMLLTWLQTVTQGFNDIDPTFLEKYFKGASENAIALLDSFGILFELIIRAGDDPGIKGFYDNLNLGASSLAVIIRESVAGAPALGRFLALTTQIIAIFADSGSVQAFFGTLNTALGAVLNFLQRIKPFIDFVGPIFATLTAITLVGSMAVTVGKIFVGLATTAFASFSKVTGAIATSNAAMGTLIAQSTAASVSTATLGASATTAGTAVSRLSLIGKAALGPFAIALTMVTGLMALLAYQQGEIQKKIDDASIGITNSMKANLDSTQVWAAALQGVSEKPVRDAIAGVENIGSVMMDANAMFENFHYQNVEGGFSDLTVVSRGYQQALEAVGNSFANIAATNLPMAQKGMRGLIKEQLISESGLKRILVVNDGYRQTLIDQADQMGINLIGTSGLIDEQLLYNFAIGEGEVKVRAMQQAQKAHQEEVTKTNLALQESVRKVVEYQDASLLAYQNNKINVEKTLENFRTRIQEAAELSTAIQTLIARGAGEALIAEVMASGEDAVTVAKGLLDLTAAEFSEIDIAAGLQAGKLTDSVQYAKIAAAIQTAVDGNVIGYETAQGFLASLNGASTIAELSRTGDNILQKIATAASNKDMLGTLGQDIATGIDGTAVGSTITGALVSHMGSDATLEGVGTASETIRAKIEESFKRPIKVTIIGEYTGARGPGGKTGGFFSDGKFIKKALGGIVRGAGTGTSDSVPAMLSNGEYVINSKATSIFRPLLDAINYGRPVSSSIVSGATNTQSQAMGAGASINITVNPSPGMDERELATVVSRRLAYELRKGTYRA